MNVARAVLDRLVQDKIDKANDRGRVRLCFNRGAIVFAQLQELADLSELFENLLHARRIGAVVLLDPLFDLLGRRNNDVNVFAECEAKIRGSAMIERINERDMHYVAAHFDRQRAVQPGQSARNQTQNFRRDFALGQVNEVGAETLSDRLIKAVLVDEAAVDHRLRDSFSIQVRLIQHVFHL